MKVEAALASWFPEAWIQLLDPAARVGAATTREALATAVQVLAFYLIFRVALTILGGSARLFSAGRGHADPGGFRGGLRRLLGFAAIALPVGRVLAIPIEGVDFDALIGLAVLAGAGWACFYAADRRGAWIEGDDPTLVVRDGFAVFSVREWRLPLAQHLRDDVTGGQLGKLSGFAGKARLSRRDWKVLTDVLGKAEAYRWLAAHLAADGILLLPPRR